MPRTPGSILTAVAVLAAGAVALAVFLQHAFGMEPCAWCTFQRLIFLAVAAAALIAAALLRARPGFVAGSALAALLAAGGVWAALHQQLVASKADSCVYTFADRFLLRTGLDESLPWLFEATASCADANAPLLGLPFAAWSAALFALLFVLSVAGLRAGLRTGRALST
jgi:disulfide bond formation protein DsbB